MQQLSRVPHAWVTEILAGEMGLMARSRRPKASNFDPRH